MDDYTMDLLDRHKPAAWGTDVPVVHVWSIKSKADGSRKWMACVKNTQGDEWPGSRLWDWQPNFASAADALTLWISGQVEAVSSGR